MAKAPTNSGKPTDPNSLFSKTLRSMGGRFKQASAAAANDTQQGFLGTTLEPQKAPYTCILDESKLVMTKANEIKIVHSFIEENGAGSAEVWDGIASDESLLYATKNLRRLGVDTDEVAANPECIPAKLANLTARKPKVRIRIVESTSDKKKQDGSSYVNVWIDRVMAESTTGVAATPAASEPVAAAPDESPESPEEPSQAAPAPVPARRGRPPKAAPIATPVAADDETPSDPDGEDEAPSDPDASDEVNVQTKVGDKVEFAKKDGGLVRGVVAKDNGDGTYNIRSDAGKLLGPIPDDKIIILE